MSDRAAVVARHRDAVAKAADASALIILAELGIGPDEEDHRRVLAVLAFLQHRGAPTL
jgi:hypothetical protein